MKIDIISILAPLASAVLLAGCTKTAPERTWATAPDAVRIEASVGALTKTYPAGTEEAQKKFKGPEGTKYPGDQIAVSVEANGQAEKTVTYEFDAEVWNPVPATDYLVWKAPVTYKAWYPASAKDGFTLPTDQSETLDENHGNFGKSDFMTGEYVCDSKDKIPSDHKLRLTMNRKMALVTVNVDKNRLKNQFDGKDIYMIRVESIQSGLSYVSPDGTGSGTPVDVKPYRYNLAYETDGNFHAIVVPCGGDASARFLKITVCWKPGYDEDKAELYVTGRPAFEAGKHYTYKLTVGKDKVEAGDITVSDWGATVDLNGDGGEQDAEKTSDPINVTALREQLKAWNDANPENKKELKDLITKELLDECCVNGKLILTGEFDNSDPLSSESEGMSKETLEAFAVIAAYVRGNDVNCLDMSGLKGVKSLTDVRAGEEVYNLRFSSVVRKYDSSGNVTESGAGSKLETFIGSGDLVDITSTFEKCAALTSVSGLDNVTDADFAFANCSKLTEAPAMPNVLSLKYTFDYTAITELKYDSAKEIAVLGCGELTIIDCPNVVRLGKYAFSGVLKLTEIRLASKFYESVHWQACDGIKAGQITLYLDAGQKDNIDVTQKTWTPKDSNGKSVVDGELPASLERFKAVYCGEEQMIPEK